MEDFSKEIFDGGKIAINVNLTRATIHEARELKKVLEEEIVFKHKKLVLDLSQCEFIDSTFIGAIVYEHKKMIERGGILNVVEPLDLNKDLFLVTRTLESLNLYKTKEEAIDGFDKAN